VKKDQIEMAIIFYKAFVAAQKHATMRDAALLAQINSNKYSYFY
jgi:hypothetical protein